MPSNFLISLAESIYFPPFQVLVGERSYPLPLIKKLFVCMAADLYPLTRSRPLQMRSASLITSDTSATMLVPSPSRLEVFLHACLGDPVFPTNQSCSVLQAPRSFHSPFR